MPFHTGLSQKINQAVQSVSNFFTEPFKKFEEPKEDIVEFAKEIKRTITERKILPEPVKKASEFLFPSIEERTQRFVDQGLEPEKAKTKATAERQFEMLPIGAARKIIKPVVGKITKGLKPLAKEVRNFATVKDFINSKTRLFRGSEVEKLGGFEGRGVFLTPSRKTAEIFAHPKGKVSEFFVDKKQLKIQKSKGEIGEAIIDQLNNFTDDLVERPQDFTFQIKRLRNKGIDAVESFDGDQLLVFDKAKVLTKSQLTNIFNQTKAVPAKIPKGQKERGFITSVKEQFPTIQKIAGQYIPRSTDNLAIKAKNLIKSDIKTAENLALTGTDDKAVATASELIKHYGQLAEKAKGAARVAFYDKAAEIAVEIAPKLTELGRSIQAAAILGRQTPEGNLRFAARIIQKHNEEIEATKGGILGLQKKVPELTGKQAEDILKRSKAIQEMADGTEKAMAYKKLQDEIADLIPSPFYKKLINLWKAGLLTGLKTSGLNTLSNLFHGTSEIVKDIPAVAVDKVSSLFTGKRTLIFTTKGVPAGVQEGFGKGLRYMKTGYDERNIGAKLDWKRVSFGKGKLAKTIKTYEEFVFRAMGAEDQPFYYGAKARSLASQAMADAKNQGIKLNSPEGRKFVQKSIENPTDDMIRNATNDAEMAVFQNRTLLSDVAKGIQRIPGGEVVVPFGRTPSAVAMQIINYSPVGIVKTIVNNIGKGRFDQRAFSQGIGRGVTGTAATFIGMELFKKDLISLDFPESERERNLWKLEGRKPNSFKTPDGKWRSVLPLGPLGMTLILGGHLQKFVDETGSVAKALVPASFSALKSFTEQTFLVGVNQFAKAINDPDRYSLSVVSRTVGSIIPTIVSDVARSTDTVDRRAFARAEGFFAPLKARLPGVRKTLEPQIDVLGSPLLLSGNALETMIDPTRPSKIKSSDLITELRRLVDEDFPATPTRFADEKFYAESLTAEEITYLQEKAGLILEGKLTNLIANDEYKALDDVEKKKVIDKFTNQSRVNARAEMVDRLTINLPSEEKKEKLKELKANRFMTEQVFDKWQELFSPSI